MKLALYRWLGNNFGDHAVASAIRMLFPSNVEWLSIDLFEDRDTALNMVNYCDGLIIGGGTILGNLRSWLIEPNVLNKIKVPIIILGTGIRDEGKSKIDTGKLNGIRLLLNQAHSVLIRGPLSVAYLQKSGINLEKIEISGDPALFLGRQLKSFAKPHGGTAINIRARPNHKEAKTIQFIHQFLAHYSEHLPKPIHFFSCHDHWDLLVESSIGYKIRKYEGLEPSLKRLANYDLIISERLHGTILGQSLGIPSVQLIYERKCLDHLHYLGCEDLGIFPEKDTIHDLYNAIKAAPQANSKIEKKIIDTEYKLQMAANIFLGEVKKIRMNSQTFSKINKAEDYKENQSQKTINRFLVSMKSSKIKNKIDHLKNKFRKAANLILKREGSSFDSIAKRTNIIGLMMICDEEDMLEEALNNHIKFCDSILVLDGTKGEGQKLSAQICLKFPQVVGYWRDEDTDFPSPIKDGARHFLLEKARIMFGLNNWYAILHGDEIWTTNPRSYLNRRKGGRDGIAVRMYHFFPHTSQKRYWNFSQESSIENLARWYMKPSIPEHRLFWDSGEYHYKPSVHGLVIPMGMNSWQSELILKQYNYRSPEQSHRRALKRIKNKWQQFHYEHLIENKELFFMDTLAFDKWKWEKEVPRGKGQATNIIENPLPIWR